MTLLPFTIEAWDHGRGLQPVTADGVDVDPLRLCACEPHPYPMSGAVRGFPMCWSKTGECSNGAAKSNLRLRPKTEKLEVFIYRDKFGNKWSSLSKSIVGGELPTEIGRGEIEVPAQ